MSKKERRTFRECRVIFAELCSLNLRILNCACVRYVANVSLSFLRINVTLSVLIYCFYMFKVKYVIIVYVAIFFGNYVHVGKFYSDILAHAYFVS